MLKKRNVMTIGTLAKTAGVGVETVRYYQRRGLMSEPEKPYGGIRHYDEQALARLHFFVINHMSSKVHDLQPTCCHVTGQIISVLPFPVRQS